MFFQDLSHAYFQDRNTVLLEGKLVAKLDDGTSVPLDIEGKGTATDCAELYKTLKSIHPSLAYIINEGINLKSRSLSWSQAWSGFKERPFLGWGPENFDLIFFKYLKGIDYEGYPPAKLDRAHSRPLDVLVNTGIVGFIIWSVFWVVLFFSVFRNILRGNNFIFNLMIVSCLTTYFVSSLFLFPQATWYVQFFILVGVVSRSDVGFLPRVNLSEVIIKKRKRRNNEETNVSSMIVTLISPIFGIVIFYWLIITPYHVASDTLPATRGKTINELEEIAGRFEPLAYYGRAEILTQALIDWNLIVALNLDDQREVLNTLEQIGLKSVESQPSYLHINKQLFIFYYNLSNTDDTFLIVAEKYAKKLIEIAPEHINAQESIIRLNLAKKDYEESKKWIDKWKNEHPNLSLLDREQWDIPLEVLKNEIK